MQYIIPDIHASNDDCMVTGCSCMAIECTPLHDLVHYCKLMLSNTLE